MFILEEARSLTIEITIPEIMLESVEAVYVAFELTATPKEGTTQSRNNGTLVDDDGCQIGWRKEKAADNWNLQHPQDLQGHEWRLRATDNVRKTTGHDT